MTTLPLERNQLVTVDGRRAIITKVHHSPGGYTVRMVPTEDDHGVETLHVGPDAVRPALLDLDDIDTKLGEASGHIDGADAPHNWPALQAMRTAEALRVEVAYLRRRLELTEDYSRLGARDGAIAAGADALLDLLRRRGEVDVDVDGATAEEMRELDAATSEEMRELAEAMLRGALPVLAPFADALQELRDILPGPCPVPSVFLGNDQCEHGTWDQCSVSRAAWIAAGLDPAEEKRRVLGEYRRTSMPVDQW